MRRSLLALLGSFSLLVLPVSAFALTTTPTTHQLQTIKQDYHQAVSAARSDFKTKLAEIKDSHKQTIVTKVDSRIEEINAKRTTQMSDALTRLSSILDRVETKVTPTTPQTTQDLIATAKTKIATAQTAVEAQKNKDYVIQITTDTALGQVVRMTLQAFSADIKTTHQTVVDARQAVIAAIKAIEPATSETPMPTTTTNL